VIKYGLIEYRESSRHHSTKSPAEFFETFDLGEGGYSIAPARQAKEAIKTKLKNKRKTA